MSVYTFHEANAFTRQGMAVIGNPAAICLVDRFPEDRVMAQAALILASPMTSFVCRTNDPLVFDIRHFSPDGNENHVCGHATLAAAEVLARENPSLRQGGEVTFRLNPRYAINADNKFTTFIRGRDISLVMPAVMELQQIDDPVFYQSLAAALRIAEEDIVKPVYYAPRIINYVVELKDQDSLLRMSPDYERLKDLARTPAYAHEGIMATAKAQTPGYDIMNRVFLPIIGVDEDLACGSANCSLLPYWTLRRAGVFDPAKRDFRALFPYPPRLHENMVGGIQDLYIDQLKEEVTVTAQAAYQGSRTLTLIPSGPAPQKGPSP